MPVVTKKKKSFEDILEQNFHFKMMIDFVWTKNNDTLCYTCRMFKSKTEQNTSDAIKIEYFNQPPSDF